MNNWGSGQPLMYAPKTGNANLTVPVFDAQGLRVAQDPVYNARFAN